MTPDPRTSTAKAWGITYSPANVAPGQGVWRCVSVDGPMPWGGRVSTFLDVLDQHGQRIVGLRVRWFNGGNAFKATEPKVGEPWSVDFPMSGGGNSYGLQIADGQPSDTVFGFGLGHFVPHHVFKVVYRYTLAGGDAPPQEPPKPPPGNVDLEYALDQIQYWLDIARGKL